MVYRFDWSGALEVYFEVQENANKVDFTPHNSAEPKAEQVPAEEPKENKRSANMVDKSNGTINDNANGQPNWNL